MAAQAYRHADAIGFDAFQVPLLLEAWVAERRSEGGAAAEAYQRAFALAGVAGFADHAAFALAGLGWNAYASGDPRGRRARAPGARRRGGGTVAVDRGARARPAGLRPGHRGRRRHRRGAVPRRARVVRQAPAAHSSREPVPRARGRPGRGRPGRPRRPRAAPPRNRRRVGAPRWQ